MESPRPVRQLRLARARRAYGHAQEGQGIDRLHEGRRTVGRRLDRADQLLGSSRISPNHRDSRHTLDHPPLRRSDRRLIRFQLLHGGGWVSLREMNQGAIGGGLVLASDGRVPARFNHPPRQGTRFRPGNGLGKHPHLARRPFARARQLDGEVVLTGLDQATEEPKPVAAREEEHRPLAKSPQREPAVPVGPGRGAFRPVAGLEDFDIGQRHALPVHHPAADCP
jgi:hypothetical protein